MTLFNQQTTSQIMELHFRKIWETMWADYVTKKCKFNPAEMWTDTSDMRIKISIYTYCECWMPDKYIHMVSPNADNHICAKISQKYNIKMFSLFVSLITKHIVVKLHIPISFQTNLCDVAFFDDERQLFINGGITNTLLVFIYETQCECFAENNVERYFADDYLLLHLLHYTAYFL